MISWLGFGWRSYEASKSEDSEEKLSVSPGAWESVYEFGDMCVQIHTLSTSLWPVELTLALGLWWPWTLKSHAPSQALLLEQKSQCRSHLRSRSQFTCLNGKGCGKYVEACGILS